MWVVRRASPHHPHTVFFALSTWKPQLKSHFEVRKCKKTIIAIKNFEKLYNQLWRKTCRVIFCMKWPKNLEKSNFGNFLNNLSTIFQADNIIRTISTYNINLIFHFDCFQLKMAQYLLEDTLASLLLGLRMEHIKVFITDWESAHLQWLDRKNTYSTGNEGFVVKFWDSAHNCFKFWQWVQNNPRIKFFIIP